MFNSNDKMKTTCWYEERRNLVGVFDFRSFFIGFLFWLRADGGLALFFFSLDFFLPGAYLLRNVGVANLVVFCVDLVPVVNCCMFGCLVVCMFFFSFSSHYIYIYGGISFWTHAWHLLWLKSCRLSVGFVCLSTSRFVDSIRSLRSISLCFRLCVIITVDIIHSTERGTGSCCLCSRVYVCVFVFVWMLR